MSTDAPDASLAALIEQVQRVYVLLEDGTRRALQPLDLTPTQFNLLRLLVGSPREGLSVSTLASRLLCTRGNISRLVARLGRAGLVGTAGLTSDERLVLVHLTPAGRRAVQLATAALQQADQERFAALDDEECTALAQRLAQVGDELHDWLEAH